MNTRSQIIATVAVLWIAVLGVIAFQALSTDETKLVRPARTTAQQRQIDDCVQTALAEFGYESGSVGASIWHKSICAQQILPPPTSETDYDVAAAAIQAAGVSLVAAVLIGATVIWTRPKDEEQVAATTPSSLPAPQLKATQTPAPAVETVASSATDPASALRQLKALHDEGILTDDEYETKRKALTDQL